MYDFGVGFLDFLFPKMCLGCGKWTEYVCHDCVNKMRVHRDQICPRCGKGSMFGRVHSRCKTRFGMDGLVRVFEYKGVVGKILRKIKYQSVTDMYQVLVEALVSMGDFEVISGEKWVLVPVPLHQNRFKKRGFNQAEKMAQFLGEYFGWKTGVFLERVRDTKPQVGLKGKERRKNVKNAFALNSKIKDQNSKIMNLSILLVDDVWTTGATMRECAKVLKRAGVKKVWGLVAAA